MAKLTLDGMEVFDEVFKKLSNPGPAAKKAVEQSKGILRKSLQKEIRKAANRGYATGDLENSIVATKTKENEYGTYSVVMPVGTDRKGTRNGEKLAYLENGTSRQQAHPVRQAAVNNAEAECTEAIQKIMEEEMGAE